MAISYKFYDSKLCKQMSDMLILNGKGESTRAIYLRQVRSLADFYDKSLALLSEKDVSDFLIHRKTVVNLSPSSMQIAHAAFRYLDKIVLGRDWRMFSIIKGDSQKRLPSVLSYPEVRRVINVVIRFHNYAYFVTIYSCGFRLHERLHASGLRY